MSHRIRKFLSHSILASALILAPSAAHATGYTWTGAHSTQFYDSLNWAPNGLPTASDTVTIGSGWNITTSKAITLAGATVGAGTSVNPSGDTIINGPFTLSGTWSSSGAVIVNGALTMGAGAKWAGSGSLTANGPAVATSAIFDGSKDFTVNNTFLATDCSFTGSGRHVITSAGVFKLQSGGGVGNTINRVFSNSGTVTWASGNLVVNAAMRNEIGAVVDVQSSGILSGKATGSLFTNVGMLKRSANGSTATLDIPYTNTGVMDVQAGTLQFTQPLSQTGGECNLNGGNVVVPKGLSLKGGKLQGSGTINGNVVNEGGLFNPGHSPGSIVINGNFTQTAGGVLNMEVGGTTPGTGYDQIQVNGTAYLDGTLNFVRWNNFTPKSGDVYTLLTFYSRVGNFASFVDLTPVAGLGYTKILGPSTYEVACYTASPDTTLPVASITKPLDGSAATTVTSATGNASDASGIKSVTVRLYRYADPLTGAAAAYWAGGTTWTATASATNDRLATGTTSWSLTLPTLVAGRYSLTATATDAVGNKGVSGTASFWVDPNAPSTLTVTTPANAASILSLSQISGTAADASNGSGIASVNYQLKRAADNLYWNGSTWVSTASSLSTSIVGNLWTNTAALPVGTNLKAGKYSIIATATDRAGNAKALTTTFTVSTTVLATSLKTG